MKPDRISTFTNGAEAGLQTLRRIVASGLLRCGLPKHAGGDGGSIDDLCQAAQDMAANEPAAALVLWAQRLAIEALAQSSNVGLREYVLPDLLSGDRAGGLPAALGGAPISGHFSGRGWRLNGRIGWVPNLQWVNCVVITPLQLDDQDSGWVLLRGEEDGLKLDRLSDHEAPASSRSADVTACNVFFREDEWLGSADFFARVAPVARALAPAIARLQCSSAGKQCHG
jgi:alkylation response protein AidB-like acyl-CoA dehydrogenase